MRSEARRILDEALQLSEQERGDLIEALGDSLEGEVELDDDERLLIQGRIEAVERGEMLTVSGDEVAARLTRALDDVSKA